MQTKIRGFEVVSDSFRKHKDVEIKLPIRATKTSAGYKRSYFYRCKILYARRRSFNS